LREAESPKAGDCQGREKRPEVPSTPHEAWNSQYQQQAAHRSHHWNAAHPAFRQPRRGDVAKPGREQEGYHTPEIDSFRHAFIPLWTKQAASVREAYPRPGMRKGGLRRPCLISISILSSGIVSLRQLFEFIFAN